MKRKERINLSYQEIEYYEGESLENKIARIVENNEPISDGSPMIYTNRADGVRPEYDIRTDKWDVAQDAMENVASKKKAKIKESMAKGNQNIQKEEEKPGDNIVTSEKKIEN